MKRQLSDLDRMKLRDARAFEREGAKATPKISDIRSLEAAGEATHLTRESHMENKQRALFLAYALTLARDVMDGQPAFRVRALDDVPIEEIRELVRWWALDIKFAEDNDFANSIGGATIVLEMADEGQAARHEEEMNRTLQASRAERGAQGAA